MPFDVENEAADFVLEYCHESICEAAGTTLEHLLTRCRDETEQAAILAERERCAGKLCSRCKSGFPYAGNGFHTNPYHTPEGPDKNQLPPLLPCDAAAILEELT